MTLIRRGVPIKRYTETRRREGAGAEVDTRLVAMATAEINKTRAWRHGYKATTACASAAHPLLDTMPPEMICETPSRISPRLISDPAAPIRCTISVWLTCETS